MRSVADACRCRRCQCRSVADVGVGPVSQLPVNVVKFPSVGAFGRVGSDPICAVDSPFSSHAVPGSCAQHSIIEQCTSRGMTSGIVEFAFTIDRGVQ